jgi:hypothetical protein
MKRFSLAVAAAVLALAASACKTASGDNASAVKDWSDDASTITLAVPQGGSTTPMMQLNPGIYGDMLNVTTNCNIQVAQVYIRASNGFVGGLARSSIDSNVWYAPSGNSYDMTHVQIAVNNFGAPTFCTYTVRRGVLPAIDPVF